MDERRRYFQRLRRLRRGARRWSVLAGTFVGAAVVLLPYRGLSAVDAIWAALAGGTGALTWWRWRDYRELAAEPAPPEIDPAQRAELTRQRLTAALAGIPGGTAFLQQATRQRTRYKLRGTTVLGGWTRLDRASDTMAALSARAIGGPVDSAAIEASVAESTLRSLGERAALLERAGRLGGGHLGPVHAQLVGHFTEGVGAYEDLVKAAAGYLAEDGRLDIDPGTVQRLSEETQRLRDIAARLSHDGARA
jgi:hypothetical protein